MMEKHHLTSLFTPGSVIVLAGDLDAPESQTPRRAHCSTG
jgi:acetyltransferase